MIRRVRLPFWTAGGCGLAHAGRLLSLVIVASWVQIASAADPPHQMRVIQTTDTLQLSDLQGAFEKVADRVADCVVAISASISPVDSDEALRSEDLNGQRLGSLLDRVTRTVGSGFVIDPNGYIVTNEHVVGEAQQIWVTTDGRKVYPAVVVGSDPRADLAVLKIPAINLPVAHFAALGTVRRGAWAIALGNPHGLAAAGEMAMSVGVVSALDRSLPKLSAREDRNYANLIQTTAEINPGNSGGPLFDLSGQVIGINAAVILPQKEVSGISFAFPITQHLLDEIAALKEGREIVYGYLGVTASTLTPRARKEAGISGDIGVNVDAIEPNSPAAAALKVKDILVSVDGQSFADSDAFVEVIGAAPLDHAAKLSLLRSGAMMEVEVKLGRRQLPTVAVNRDNQRLRWNGLLLGAIPTNWNFGKAPRPTSGMMVIGIADNSPLAKQVTTGSIITSIAGKPISAIADLQAILNDTPPEQCKIQLAQPGEPQVAAASQH